MSSVGNSTVFLGLLGAFPSTANGHRLRISLTNEKREKRAHLLDSFLKEGRISRICLGKLIGRLGFSQTCIFGKFARTQIRPLYQKFHQWVYNAQLSRHERCTFERWRAAIADFTLV